MVSVFTTKTSLEDIFLNEDKKAWQAIILKLNEVFINEDPFSDCDNVDPDDNVFLTLNGMGVNISDKEKDFIDNIPNEPSSVLKYPCGIFLLEIEDEKAKSIQNDYGVICQPTSRLDYMPLAQPSFPNELEENETGRSWEGMISRFKQLPSNSALIIDAHLFQKDRYDERTNSYDENNSKGINNLFDILNAILPQHFVGTYHVGVLLTDYDVANKNISQNNLTNKRIANAINKLKSKKLNRNYNISIEVVFISEKDNASHKLIHNRRIISNYFIVTADYGLVALNKGRCLLSQTITAFPLFENIQNDSQSDKKEKRMRRDLNDLKAMMSQQNRAIQPTLTCFQSGKQIDDLSTIIHPMLRFSQPVQIN